MTKRSILDLCLISLSRSFIVFNLFDPAVFAQ
jgi:hypothetical protein